jgi:hypothetical protein
MAWTSPGTAEPGGVLSSDFWNLQVRDNLANLRALANVQQAAVTTPVTTGTTAFADISGMSVAITPTASTSKVLVTVSINASVSNAVYSLYFRLMRGATAIGVGSGSIGGRTACTFEISDVYSLGQNSASMMFLDSPATTSATTYKLQWLWPAAAGGNAYLNRTNDDTDAGTRSRTISTITVQEIPA